MPISTWKNNLLRRLKLTRLKIKQIDHASQVTSEYEHVRDDSMMIQQTNYKNKPQGNVYSGLAQGPTSTLQSHRGCVLIFINSSNNYYKEIN